MNMPIMAVIVEADVESLADCATYRSPEQRQAFLQLLHMSLSNHSQPGLDIHTDPNS